MQGLADRLFRRLTSVDPADSDYVPQLVTAILASAREAQATDVHLVPQATHVQMHWRIDGVLQAVAQFPPELAPRLVARLKVLSGLLTYRTSQPQEGRLQTDPGKTADETRISTFPTLFGEKTVIRLFVGANRYHRLDDLGLPVEVAERLGALLGETGGVILVAGPAGSGKTTTLYAALRELVDKSAGGRSLVSLEDPIEMVVPGVAQSQVMLADGFDMPTGLRSLLRQDPEVIMVGEIRDASTAETVFQAALTGHLVLTTFHAGSAAQSINRLSDMGIEPYLLRSGVQAILCQRLVRRLCECARPAISSDDRLGLPVSCAKLPRGCSECHETGYCGRFLLCEMLLPQGTELGRAILSRSDASRLQELAAASGMTTQFARACQAVEAGQTSPAEVRRVLGFSGS